MKTRKWFVFLGMLLIIGLMGYWVWMDPGRKAMAIEKMNEWGLQELIAKMRDSAPPVPGPEDAPPARIGPDPAPATATSDPQPEPGPVVSEPAKPADDSAARAAVEFARAEAFLETGNLQKSLAAVERCLALDPGNTKAAVLRERIDAAQARAKESDEAKRKAELEAAQKIATAAACVEAARALLEAKQFPQARVMVDKARAADPGYVAALELLVEIQKAELVATRAAEEKRMLDESDDDKRKAAEKAQAEKLAEARRKAENYIFTAEMMLDASDPAKAAELALKATEIDPANDKAKAVLRKAQAALAELKKKEYDQKTLEETARKASAAALAEGETFLAAKKFDEAVAKGNAALKLVPGSPDARVFLARVDAEKAKAERAEALAAASVSERTAAEELARKKTETARQHLAVAAVYLEKDDLDRSASMTEKALELDPGSKEAIALVGKIASRRQALAAQAAAEIEAARKLKAAEDARRRAEREKEMELALELAKRKEELEKALAEAKAAEEARQKAAEEQRKADEAARLKAEEEARLKADAEAQRIADEEARKRAAEEAARTRAAKEASDKKAVMATVSGLDEALEAENAARLSVLFDASARELAASEAANAQEFFAIAESVKTARTVESIDFTGDTSKVTSHWTISYRLKGAPVSVAYSSEFSLKKSGDRWLITEVKNVRQK